MRRATSFRWRTSYRIPTPYSSDARTQPVSAWSPAPPIQPLPLPAMSLSGPITSTASINSKFPPNVLLRRPSHNYCCSSAHRITTAAPAPIAQQLLRGTIALASSSSSIFDSTLDATVPTSRSCSGGRYSFLWRTKLEEPPTEIS